MNRPRIVIPLAPGYEETEALAPADVLSRSGLDVVLVHLPGETTPVAGSHGFALETHAALDSIDEKEFDAVCLPGGTPGITNLRRSEPLLRLIRNMHHRGAWIAAICAAPRILQEAGIISGRRVTSHPSVRDTLRSVEYYERPVVVDGTIITSRGPGTALLFGLTIAAAVKSVASAVGLAEKMVVEIPPAVMEEWINGLRHNQ